MDRLTAPSRLVRRVARPVVVALLGTGALLVQAVPAGAHAGNGDTTVGHVCIDADGGYHLAGEEASGTCPSGQTAAHLSSTPITGPQMTIAGSDSGATTTGTAGPAGAIGPRGPSGPTGPTGPSGAAGTDGLDGLDGLNGLDGADGAQGPQGPAGPAGAQGNTGTAGAQGPQGPAGANGDDGELGPAGPQGPQGPAGTAGTAGATGPAGTAGTAGATGPQGPAGAAGAAGAAGPVGPAGTSILNGAADPVAQGNNGDYYIQTTTMRIWGPKAAGVWTGPGTSLIGTAGATILSGVGNGDGSGQTTTPPDNATGANGDFFFDTNDRVFYGPKAAGAWPGTGTSLIGNTGAAGTPGAAGATILSGVGNGTGLGSTNTPPGNGTGADGDFFFDTDDRVLYGPKAAGAWPATGTLLSGASGADGRTILNGTDDPSVTPPAGAADGDFYLETDVMRLYGPRTAGAWGAGVVIQGTNGTNGSQFLSGAVAPTTEGVDGDFYFDTVTKTLYGPKAGGAWGSGTVLSAAAAPRIIGGGTGSANLTNNATRFIGPFVGSTGITEASAAMRFGDGGVLTELWFAVATAPGAAASGKSWTFTVFKNGVATAMTGQILETATEVTITDNPVTFADGDKFSIQIVPSGTPTAAVGRFTATLT